MTLTPTPLLAAEVAGHTPPLDVWALTAVLVAAWLSGRLATRIGYPAVLGELLAGIVLGPPLLGLLGPGDGLAAIGDLGVVLMMLWVGTEIDLANLRRASRAGLYAAIGGFVVPFAGGVAVMRLFDYGWTAGVFVGAAVGVTSLATKSRILADLRLFDTRIAYVLMAGALLSDTATLVIFAAVLALAGASAAAAGAATLLVAAKVTAFFAVAVAAGWVMPRLGRLLQHGAGLQSTAGGLSMLVGLGLAAATLAELMGLHAILGSFVAGIIARRGLLPKRTEKRAVTVLGRLSLGVLAPVFFTTAGFAIDLAAVLSQLPLVAAVIAVATFGKILGTALAYLPTGNGWREGIVVGAAMNGRGAVEIIVAGIGLSAGLITAEVFSVLVVMAVVTTATVPVLLKLGVQWLRSRDELADASDAPRGITILGAGSLARHMAAELSSGRQVKLLDSNAARVAQAQALGLDAVLGDATDLESLRAAGVDDAELVLCLTPNFEVNLLSGQLAREEFGVRHVQVATGPEPHDSVADLLARSGLRELGRALDVEHLSGLLDDGVVRPAVREVGARDLELGLQDAVDAERHGLPVAVRRSGKLLPYALDGQLQAGDHLVVLARADEMPSTITILGHAEAADLP